MTAPAVYRDTPAGALGVLRPALEALGTMAPALGAFQVIAIDKPPADG